MKTRWRFAWAWTIGTLLVTSLAWGQEQYSASFMNLYDVDSATTTYCVMKGRGGDPFAGPIPVQGNIATSGTSTTVDEVTTGSNPFTNVAVGDTIIVDRGQGNVDAVVVTARASAAEITVSSSVDWENGGDGYPFGYYDQTCGTSATAGWIDVSKGTIFNITVQYEQGDLDALLVRWECKTSAIGAQPVILYPGENDGCGGGGTYDSGYCSFATPGISARLSVVDSSTTFSQCRLGVRYASTDTSDAGTDLEQVTGTLTVTRYR
jgi:hypothetical protein